MPHPHLILSREAERLGTARDLRRAHASGHLVRVRSGVYADAQQWTSLDADEKYRSFVHAAALVSGDAAQFSHDSAAALWQLPSIGPWPSMAHELVAKGPGGTSRRGIRRHGLGLDPSPVRLDSVLVTSLDRTLLDMSCSTTFGRAVTMLDDALRPTRAGDPRHGWDVRLPTLDGLKSALAELLPYPGSARAGLALDFATALSGSPGETYSRVQFHALGLPAPELQVEFFDADGSIGFADFYWRHLDLIGEFDGASKYSAARRYQRGISLEQLLLEEKAREDRMRRVARSFARLRWPVVNDRRALAAYLRPFGLVARAA